MAKPKHHDRPAPGCARGGIVLCPLRYELKHVRAANIAGKHHALECCGPGSTGVQRWFERNEARISQAAWVLLVGLAGAIDPAISPGTAHAAAVVINSDGQRHRPSMAPIEREGSTVAVTTSDELIRTPAERISLRSATGAQLVDQESAHFAACAVRLGVRWGIVRGVSDGVDTALPHSVSTWVDSAGRTRLARVLVGLLRSPGDLPKAIALGRVSGQAMRAAALQAARLIECAADAETG